MADKPEDQVPNQEPDKVNELQDQLAQRDEKIVEMEGRLETMQDSLDTLVEEFSLSKRSERISEEPEDLEKPQPVEKQIEKKEKIEEEVPEGQKVERDIESAIQEEENWKRNVEQTQEQILVNQEVKELENQWNEAIKQFPLADKEKVFLEIEDGSEKSVSELAQKSHEVISARDLKIKEEAETGIKQQVQKEGEGSLNLPQSTGPNQPAPQGQPKRQSELESDAWGAAAREAKKGIQQ